MDDYQRFHRRSTRLKEFDYSLPGAYFVTIVVQECSCVLGKIINGEILLSKSGEIVERCWLDLPKHYLNVQLDEFCIMPNHVHGVVVLTDCRGGSGIGLAKVLSQNGAFSSKDASPEKTRPYGLFEIVRAFKSFSARRINKIQGTSGLPFWQRG